MPAERNKELVRRMTDAFNTGEFTVVDQVLEPDSDGRAPVPGVPKTSTELKKKITALRRAFPDLRYTVDRIVAEEETVAFRWTMTGTHSGPLLGKPPTHRSIEHSGTDLVTFRDGKIVEHYAGDNFGELLGKLGIERVMHR